MISIARGNKVNTKPAHEVVRADVSMSFPEPAMEYRPGLSVRRLRQVEDGGHLAVTSSRGIVSVVEIQVPRHECIDGLTLHPVDNI